MVEVVDTGAHGSQALGMGLVQTGVPSFTSDFRVQSKKKTPKTQKSAKVLSKNFTALITHEHEYLLDLWG